MPKVSLQGDEISLMNCSPTVNDGRGQEERGGKDGVRETMQLPQEGGQSTARTQ